MPAHLERRLGERIIPEAPIGFVERTPPDGFTAGPARSGRTLDGHPPALPGGGEAEVLEPHRLEPAEGDVHLGHVELTARIGDPGLAVNVRCAVAARSRVDLVAPGEVRRLAAHGGPEHPGGRSRRALGAVFSREHHRAGAVGRRARLEIADRDPTAWATPSRCRARCPACAGARAGSSARSGDP